MSLCVKSSSLIGPFDCLTEGLTDGGRNLHNAD